MARLPDDYLRRLQDSADIVDLFSAYTEVKKRGRTYVCRCPFHSEKTPSCTIYPDSQSFYCFGCGAGGSVFTFIQKTENVGFMDAVQILAQRSGIPMPQQDPEEQRSSALRRRCLEINREAANLYYLNLIKGPDRAGLQYFAGRKLRPETIKQYGLGFAPDDWHFLRDQLRAKGYTEDEMVAAGVCRRSEKGGVYDYFRNRVMFPIIDLRGSVIAFGGRVLDDSKPKYLNTNDTPVFQKGSNLFSLNFAKNAASKKFLLAEGYMDVIALNQAGFPNAVATLGTAITEEQARIISHYADEVIISYDSDAAGQTATQRAMQHFSAVGLPVRILHMEGAKDPDEYIKKYGADQFRLLIDNAGDAVNFRLDRCKEGLDLSTEIGKNELLRRSVRVLAELTNPLEREVYIKRTAQALDIRVEVLQAQVDKAVESGKRFAKKAKFRAIEAQSLQRDELNPDAQQFPKESKAERQILAYLLRYPEEYEMLWAAVRPEDFATDLHRRVYEAICELLPEHPQFSLTMLEDQFTVKEMGYIYGIEAKYKEVDLPRDTLEECIAVLKNRQSSAVGDITEDELLRAIENRRNNG